MTPTTRADRLREAIQVIAATGMIFPADRVALEAGLNQALAEARQQERKRIREWVDDHDWQGAEGHIVFYDGLRAILDAPEEQG